MVGWGRSGKKKEGKLVHLMGRQIIGNSNPLLLECLVYTHDNHKWIASHVDAKLGVAGETQIIPYHKHCSLVQIGQTVTTARNVTNRHCYMAEYIPKGNNTSQNCGTRIASREKQNGAEY